jgi:ATP-binding cassette subfamily C protein
VKENSPQIQNRYVEALNQQRFAFYLVFLFSALVNILMLTGSIYMLQVYDRVLASGSVPTLLALFSIVVVLYMFFGFFDFLRSRMLSRIALRITLALGPDTFEAWLKSGAQQSSPAQKLEDLQHPIRHLATLRQFLPSNTAVSLFDLPYIPVFLCALFLVHPWLGMMVVMGAMITGLIALVGNWIARKWHSRGISLDNASHEFAGQCYQDAETITAMGMQKNVIEQWKNSQHASLSAQQKASNPSETLAASSKAFRMLLQSSILTVGALLVLQNQISAGMIVAASILSGRALAPIDQLVGQWRSLGRAAVAHRQIHSFFAGLQGKQTHTDLPAPTGAISVVGLTKRIAGPQGTIPTRLLSGLDFALAPGDGLGVVGKSGSGKSTLARILVGAWTAEQGQIRLDGATYDQWDPASLGKFIGYLPQKVELLAGTIGRNIARFDPDAKTADIISAAQLAGVHEMILKMPQGYETPIGLNGNGTLSGGQLQRLGLARAVYGNPRIVVLDEPNSNLDAEGDEALGQAILQMRSMGATVIVMAHRPSAIEAVNKIMLLHEGRIVRFDDKEKVLGPSEVVKPTPEATPSPVHNILPKTTVIPKTTVTPDQTIKQHRTSLDQTPSENTKLAHILKAERARSAMENTQATPQRARPLGQKRKRRM